MLSRLSLKTGNREYSCSRNSARRSPIVASSRMRDDVGPRRHHLADERVAEVDDALQQPALLALDDALLLAAVSTYAFAGVVGVLASASSAPGSGASRGARHAIARSSRVTGPSARATGANDGSSSSSTRSGSRPTISSGSSSSQTTTNADDAQRRRASRVCAPSMPIARASSAVAAAVTSAEQEPDRDEQQQRIVEVGAERVRADRCARRPAAATAASAR